MGKKTFLIAEKKEVGIQIVSCLSNLDWEKELPKVKGGYFENSEYISSWAMGHLFVQKKPREIDANWGLFTFSESIEDYKLKEMTSLLINHPYKFKTPSNDKYKKNQIAVLKKIFERNDIDKIIVCTDADAEGEAIGRDILTLNKNKNIPIFRLWNTGSFKSPDAIKDSFSKLKPLSDKKYENLYKQQRARNTCDYMVGMKITKSITDTQGTIFETGRLKALLISILAKRELDIKNFKPRPLWKIYGELGSLKIAHSYKDEDNKEVVSIYDEKQMKDTLEICNRNKNIGLIELLEKNKTSTKERPLPMSGTDFSNEMMDKYKISLDNCNKILSFLREEGLTSYQGTNGRYFSKNDKDEVVMCIDVAKQYFKGEKIIESMKFDINNSIFNDKKAEKQNHTPLTVRAKIPNDTLFKDLEVKSKLPYLKEAYELILKRVICNFLEADELIKQKMVISIEDKKFILEGTKPIRQGWREILPSMKIKDTTFDDSELKVGSKVKFDSIKVEESTTTKPSVYTVKKLLSMMLNVSKELNLLIAESDDIDEKKRLEAIRKTLKSSDVGGIGTDRTRPTLVSELKDFEYIDIKGKDQTITLLEKAWKIYDLLPSALKDFGFCANWENKFEDIRNGDLGFEEFVLDVDSHLFKMIEEIHLKTPISKENKREPKASKDNSSAQESKDVLIETPKTFKLNNKFVFKNALGKDLTKKEAEKILKGEQIEISRISNKTKTPYKAKIVLASSNDGKLEVSF
jgi:DNA topoisomerase III